MGFHALHRIYETKDAWMLVAGCQHESEIPNVWNAIKPHFSTADVSALQAEFSTKTYEEWSQLLAGKVQLVQLRSMREICRESMVGAYEPRAPRSSTLRTTTTHSGES